MFRSSCSTRVDSWRNHQGALWCIYSRSGTAARMLNRPVPVRRSAALLIGPWMRYLASPHLTLSLCVYRGGRAHTSRVVFAPLPNTRSRRRGRRPVQSRWLRSLDAKHVSRFAGSCKVPSGTTENSPRFQPWVTVEKGQSPGGAKENVDGPTWL